MSSPVLAQQARITSASISGSVINIEAEAATAGDYVLLRGDTVDRIDTPVLTNQPSAGRIQYVFNLSAQRSSSFFRVAFTALPTLTTIAETSPLNGEGGVSVNRETIVRFSAPLAANAILGINNFYASVGGRKLLSRVELSADRRTAILFYLEPLPGSTRIYAAFDGTGLTDHLGQPLDADGDGRPGGAAPIVFDTLSNTPVPDTVVKGSVFASELVPGPDTGTGAINRPLEGVIITVDGAEESLRAVTDAQGNFTLANAPAGRFFVHIDGRQAKGSDYPNGAFYPFVGKAWEALPGQVNLAGDNTSTNRGNIYLPLIRAGTLQPVSAVSDTIITFPPAVIADDPALAGVQLTVPANALFNEAGTRGGRVGIAPVPPDRLPGPLPPGLDFPIVFTVQSDGAQNFDRPVPVRFPNLPDPQTGKKLAPGEKTGLWSFNHDLGRWEVVGSMTVTPDGDFVASDPGVGIRQPGWGGVNPGTPGGGGPIGGPPPCNSSPSPCKECLNGQLVNKPDGQITPWVRVLSITVPNPTCADLGGTILDSKEVNCWVLISSQMGFLNCVCRWRLESKREITRCLHPITEEAFFCANGVRTRKTRIQPAITELIRVLPLLIKIEENVIVPRNGQGCPCIVPNHPFVEDRDCT